MVQITNVPTVLAAKLAGPPVEQEKFSWSIDKWRPILTDVPEALETLSQLEPELGREEVRRVVHAELAAERPYGAFVPVVIWGGPGGYGPARMRSILTGHRSKANANDHDLDPSVPGRLLAGASTAREEGLVEAFRLMNNKGRIKYLRGPFFTKWLYFTTAVSSIDEEGAAPILDKRVRDWVSTATAGAVELSPYSTSDYSKYLDVLDAWGRAGDSPRTRVQVEVAIFQLSRNKEE